jgi:hypothetical protein
MDFTNEKEKKSFDMNRSMNRSESRELKELEKTGY